MILGWVAVLAGLSALLHVQVHVLALLLILCRLAMVAGQVLRGGAER